MLGVIGFTAAAIVITSFVWSASRAYIGVDTFRFSFFKLAFGLLAAAMLVWAVVVLRNDTLVTKELMLAADALLLAATICMVVVATGPLPIYLYTLFGVASALLLGYRAYMETSAAYVQDGLLYFNLEGASRFVVVGIFALIWLPAAMFFASKIARSDPLLRRRQLTLQLYFVALVAVFGVFAKARRPEAIIWLFVMIVALFLVMASFNLALVGAHKKVQRRAQRATHRSK